MKKKKYTLKSILEECLVIILIFPLLALYLFAKFFRFIQLKKTHIILLQWLEKTTKRTHQRVSYELKQYTKIHMVEKIDEYIDEASDKVDVIFSDTNLNKEKKYKSEAHKKVQDNFIEFSFSLDNQKETSMDELKEEKILRNNSDILEENSQSIVIPEEKALIVDVLENIENPTEEIIFAKNISEREKGREEKKQEEEEEQSDTNYDDIIFFDASSDDQDEDVSTKIFDVRQYDELELKKNKEIHESKAPLHPRETVLLKISTRSSDKNKYDYIDNQEYMEDEIDEDEIDEDEIDEDEIDEDEIDEDEIDEDEIDEDEIDEDEIDEDEIDEDEIDEDEIDEDEIDEDEIDEDEIDEDEIDEDEIDEDEIDEDEIDEDEIDEDEIDEDDELDFLSDDFENSSEKRESTKVILLDENFEKKENTTEVILLEKLQPVDTSEVIKIKDNLPLSFEEKTSTKILENEKVNKKQSFSRKTESIYFEAIEKSLDLLSKVGFQVDTKETCDIFGSYGCKIDQKNRKIRISKEIIENIIRNSSLSCSTTTQNLIIGGCCNRLMDYESKVSLEGSTNDVKNIIKLFNK